MTAIARVASTLDLHITEKAFTGLVMGLFRLRGWAAYHTWRSVHSEPGFPDVCAVKPPRVVFAELKAERGKLTPAQERWLWALRQVPGVEVFAWRPSDWQLITEVIGK